MVDSIIALHRAEFTGRGTLAERQQRLNTMLHKLNRLAEVHNIAVVITNQGSAKLDSFLKGGIETQAITEIAGEFGNRKSQICYTLSVTANTPLDRKGFGGNVIFIGTENTFRSENFSDS